MSKLPTIPILITKNLEKVLTQHNIAPKEYQPAYNGTSVGLDLYNTGPTIRIPPGVIDYKKDLLFEQNSPSDDIIKDQFDTVFKQLIPTGVCLALPPHWTGVISERGSIIKTPLKVRAGIIDPGYTDECFVNCVNLSLHPYEIKHGAKLPFQLVVLQANSQYEPVTVDEYRDLVEGSTRKGGKIGSSDTQ